MTMAKNRLLLRFLVALATAFTLLSSAHRGAAEATPKPAAAPVAVRLAINLSPISALPLIAKNKGLFQKHGLDLTLANFSSGRQALETVLGGGADAATAAESPVTAAAFAQQKIALLARLEHSELKTLVSVPGVTRPSELKGKRLGYTAGTGSEVYTHELLKRSGLGKADVTLVNLRPQDMVAAAAAGSIDAYNIWEPHVANGKKALGARARVLETKQIYTETFNLVVTEEYARQQPKVATALLRALIEAETWLKANREEAITLVARLVGMPRNDLAAVWDDYVFEVALDEITTTALKKHAQWRIDSGNAAGGAKTLPDLARLIQSGPLKEVAPGRVKL
jgi:NitT/TauT family transport system substrate-binding protein